MQRGQKIDGSDVVLLDRRRRIPGDDTLVAEILHDNDAVIEIGMENFRRRQAEVA